MAENRAVIFNLEDKELIINWGSYALILYYATQLDQLKAKVLYDITITEYWYRIIYNQPLEGWEKDNFAAHFNATKLSESIDFIQNTLIPALSLENQDLINKYGGEQSFYNLFNNSNIDFFEFIGITSHESYDDLSEIIFLLNLLSNTFQESIIKGKPFNRYID